MGPASTGDGTPNRPPAVPHPRSGSPEGRHGLGVRGDGAALSPGGRASQIEAKAVANRYRLQPQAAHAASRHLDRIPHPLFHGQIGKKGVKFILCTCGGSPRAPKDRFILENREVGLDARNSFKINFQGIDGSVPGGVKVTLPVCVVILRVQGIAFIPVAEPVVHIGQHTLRVQQDTPVRLHGAPPGEGNPSPRPKAVKDEPPALGEIFALRVRRQTALQGLIPHAGRRVLQPALHRAALPKGPVDFGKILVEVGPQEIVSRLPLMEPDVGCKLCHLASLLYKDGRNPAKCCLFAYNFYQKPFSHRAHFAPGTGIVPRGLMWYT